MQKYLLKKDAWDVKHEKKLERIGNNLIAEVKPAPCASDSECDSDVTCPSSPSRSCDSGSSYESSLGSASIEGDEPLLDTWESMELAPIKTDIDDFFDRCVPEPSVSGEERGNGGTEGRADGQTEGRTDGRADERTGGWADGHTVL